MKSLSIQIASTALLVFFSYLSFGQSDPELRRPISPEQPMWLIHIDTWNNPDPQKIIDLIPKDILPYVVMNISLSVSHDPETYRFRIAEDGYEIAKSWLRVCAENRVWAVVQHASGSYKHFPDGDLSIYEEFYEEFPNLIGFSYAEQSWGFGDQTPINGSWEDRMDHFADLLELSNQHGGYLIVSWTGNRWVQSINPIAMLKRHPGFRSAASRYTENYILCEKYTFKSYLSDMESLCLGTYLSGYAGQYGLRYDDSGWSDGEGNINENFTMATYGAPFLEHVTLTGQTVIDAPELIWRYCFQEVEEEATTDGYTARKWETFPQFDNVSVDLFRKVLDGTIRIPSRQEVIDRTKVVIVNSLDAGGSDDDLYSSPERLFEGLYRMDGDGNLRDNITFFKKTGRYPTIPTVYQLNDDPARSFQLKINKANYANRWSSISDKLAELNELFPEEYTGDLYAGRHENTWVTYNPYKSDQTASASIPFTYNTSERMELSFSRYTAGIIKEYPDHLSVYLSNYDIKLDPSLKTDIIKIYGSTAEPTVTYEDRGDHQGSIVSKNWANGVLTITIEHNGPIDLSISCSGSATNRLTDFTPANLITPFRPPVYFGAHQYEAETFEYKNIARIIKRGGTDGDIRNYTGQGYLEFGTGAATAVRDQITVLKDGTYKLETRYTVEGQDVNTVDLYVNGTKVGTPTFTATSSLSNWGIQTELIQLVKGTNTIAFMANGSGIQTLYLDNIVIENTDSSTDGVSTNQPPFAFAGTDQTARDEDGDGSETVLLESSGSVDADGIIESYLWSIGNTQIATGASPAVALPVGNHLITLTVIDDEGAIDTDEVNVAVFARDFEFSDIWLEPECGTVGQDWQVVESAAASNAFYVTVKPGTESLQAPPDDSEGLIVIPFSVKANDSYTLHARLNCPSFDDDSFWIKMDNGEFMLFNGLKNDGWEWIELTAYDLVEGDHRLTIGYREDGALLDKLYISNSSDKPIGSGGEATNCEIPSSTEELANGENLKPKLWQNQPNPFTVSTSVGYQLKESGYTELKIFNLLGQEIETLVDQYQLAGEYQVVWEVGGLPTGTYLYTLQQGESTVTKKMTVQ